MARSFLYIFHHRAAPVLHASRLFGIDNSVLEMLAICIEENVVVRRDARYNSERCAVISLDFFFHPFSKCLPLSTQMCGESTNVVDTREPLLLADRWALFFLFVVVIPYGRPCSYEIR